MTSITNNLVADRTQTFTYDELNRIKIARTQATTGTYAWGLQFGYDVWGNLLSASVTQGTAPMLSVAAGTNNRLVGYSYDAAGNMLNDGSFAYAYDAENRMKTAASVSYTYDGDGRRVQKSSGKLYWYGMSGDPITETDFAGNNPVEYVFFGGKRIARRDSAGAISCYFADHLGSSRVVASSTGTILDDSDFYPFGGERIVLSSSGNNYKFTAKERDTESGLDNFGARYNSSSMGRFMSPDSSSYSTLKNPQSWNLYAYTLNNPLNYIDPDGHVVQCKTNANDCLKAAQAAVGKDAAARLGTTTVAGKQNFFQKLFGIKAADKTVLTISGDVKSFKGLSGNASKLADLVTDKRTFGVSISTTASPTYTGLADKILSGGAETPFAGGITYTPSMGAEPEVYLDPRSSEGVDTDAARDGIPAANIGEKFAHELLGHLWGEVFGGHNVGTAANKQDSIRSENEVRATDPTRGQKTKHHD